MRTPELNRPAFVVISPAQSSDELTYSAQMIGAVRQDSERTSEFIFIPAVKVFDKRYGVLINTA